MPGASRENWEEEAAASGNSVPSMGIPPGATGELTAIPPPAPEEEENVFAIVDTVYPKVIFSTLVYPFEDAQSIAQKAALVELVNEQRMLIVVDLSWEDVEAVEDTLVWTKVDVLVAWACANEIDIMFNITNVPEWASGDADNQVPPTDPTDFADFAAAAAQRYGPYGDYIVTSDDLYPVKHWMIWDKFPSGSAAAYASILVESFDAIRAKSPISLVFTGGMTAATAVASIGTIYSNGGLGKFDYATISPYDGVAAVSAAESSIAALRTAMNAAGDSSLIFVKWGIKADSGDSSALSTYRVQMTKLFNLSADTWRDSTAYGVYAVAWNSLSDTTEGNYGLITSGSTPQHKTAAYDTFKTLLSADLEVISKYPRSIDGNFSHPFVNDDNVARFANVAGLLGTRRQQLMIRTPIRWRAVEPNAPGDNNWQGGGSGFGYDGLVEWMFDHGVDPWFTIEATPAWANGGLNEEHPPLPAFYSAFGDFCTLVAQRYGVGGTFSSTLGTGNWGFKFVVIENEPNIGHRKDAGWTGVIYGDILPVAYAAIKAVDPNIVVVGAALTTADGNANMANFLNNILASGGAGNADAWAINPYSGDDLDGAQTSLGFMRNKLDLNGMGTVPIFISEWGITGSTQNRINIRTALIEEYFNVRRPSWLAVYNCTRISWFSLTDLGASAWGLTTEDGVIKGDGAAYNAFKDSLLGR